MQIIRKFTFDAAHYLPSYHGKCERLHGHTYRMSVKVDGKPDYEGMVMDFAEMKKIVNEKVIEQLDHKMLNDIFDVPSAENIASTTLSLPMYPALTDGELQHILTAIKSF